MGSTRRSKSSQKRGQTVRNRPQDSKITGGISLEETREARSSPAVNALSFAGYSAAIWLITQPLSSLNSQPGFGFAWSPALLGVLLAVATAIARDERGVRSRLGITDFSGRRASLIWGGLGLLGIFSIMTLPR